jgi:hypothetical protein
MTAVLTSFHGMCRPHLISLAILADDGCVSQVFDKGLCEGFVTWADKAARRFVLLVPAVS